MLTFIQQQCKQAMAQMLIRNRSKDALQSHLLRRDLERLCEHYTAATMTATLTVPLLRLCQEKFNFRLTKHAFYSVFEHIW